MAQVGRVLLRRQPNAPPYVVLRERLIAARKASGLSQEAVAQMIGRPQSFVAKVERGERSLDVVEFIAISRVVGLDVVDMSRAVAAKL